MRGVDCPQCLMEAMRQFECVVVRPKMDKERTRLLIDHVIVNRRDLDSAIAQGLDQGLYLACDRDEITGDRGPPIGHRLEIDRSRDAIAGGRAMPSILIASERGMPN